MLNAPHFSGEAEVSLTGAALTSSGCTSPTLAIDDDPATAAVFGPPTLQTFGTAQPALQSSAVAYFNGGLPVPAGSYQVSYAGGALNYTGGSAWGINTTFSDGTPNPRGGSPNHAFYLTDGTRNLGLTPGTTAFFTTAASCEAANAGLSLAFTHAGGPLGVYLHDNPFGDNAPAPDGGPTFGLAPAVPTLSPRFLRVDWGFDAFITRIRLDQSGPGAVNAGIDFESSLGLAEFGSPPNNPAAADVPFLAYMPLPIDGTVHELLVQPPFLANGIVFYPDAFSAASGSYPSLNLSQLQVYEAITNPGVTPMATQPTVQPARVGVQSLILYPWLTPSSLSLYQAGGNGANLYGLKTMNMDLTLKQAVVEGGEIEHPIAGFGTGRQMKVGFENAKSDLSTFQKVFGGNFILIPANANGGEVQYFTENYADRELYVALVAQSTNGDGSELIVLPKLKVESVSYQLDKDKVTDIKMDFMRFWDYTYTRQDGQIGGIYERTFGSTGTAAFHS